MMEVVVTTGAIRRVKFQSNCHHQQTKTELFTGKKGKGMVLDIVPLNDVQ